MNSSRNYVSNLYRQAIEIQYLGSAIGRLTLSHAAGVPFVPS